MERVFFWKNWPKPERNLYQFLFSILVAVLFFYAAAYVEGVDQILSWEQITFKKWIAYPIDFISYGYSSIPITVDVPILYGSFQGSDLQLNTNLAIALISITAVAVAYLLAVVSTLDRAWYIGGMVMFILFIVGFRMENLLIFNSVQKWPTIGLLITIIPLSYYFNEINRNVKLTTRVYSFILVFALFAVVVALYSNVPEPALYLVNYGYFGFLAILILFLLMISHEVINGFLYLTTRSVNNPNAARDFTIISALYLINLFVVFLNKMEFIQWTFYFANSYLLFAISVIIGIWGMILRSNLFSNVIQFKPFGALAYLALAVISFSTIGYFLSTGNDPILAVIEDLILYSHIGFGLIFFIYILSNFSQPLSQGMKVYKIVYDPKVMPYFTFRFAGIITVIALALPANYKTYVYKTLSGYYNNIGDLYLLTDDGVSAKAYYKEGSDYGYLNHRSNYLLGKMYEDEGDFQKAEEFYVKAIQRKPTTYAFANLAGLYLEKDKPYDAVFLLEEGLNEFPNDGVLNNNMGMAMNAAGVLDSALIYLFEATQHEQSVDMALTNSIGLIMENGIDLDYDSIIRDRDIQDFKPLENNVSLLKGIDSKIRIDNIGIRLSTGSSAYLYNQLISMKRPLDSAEYYWLDSVRSDDINYRYQNTLNTALAVNQYLSGDINNAVRIQDYAANNAITERGTYFRRLGLWALKYGGYERSLIYFESAIRSGDRDALIYKTIDLLELNRVQEATQLLALLSASGDFPLATSILSGINAPDSRLDSLDKEQLYFKARYGLRHPDPEDHIMQLRSISDEDVRSKVLVELGRRAFWSRDLKLANRFLRELDGLKITGIETMKRALMLEMDILIANGESETARMKFDQWKSVPGISRTELAYYGWEINEEVPDIETVFLIGSNPFKPDQVGKVIGYLNERGMAQQAYRLAVEVLEIDPHSPGLLETYIYQCARLGYTNYGDRALKDLDALINDSSYNRISVNYQVLLTRYEKDWVFDED